MKKKGKEKTYVFSKIIDDRINGYAIGISFLIISTFLLIKSTYFYFTAITYIIGAIFGIIGIAGIGTELDKTKKIKGIGNLVIGLILLGIWLALYIGFKNNIVANIFGMVFLIIGAYGFVRGLLELLYSIWLGFLKSDQSIGQKIKTIVLFLTQIGGLTLTILNILKVFKLV